MFDLNGEEARAFKDLNDAIDDMGYDPVCRMDPELFFPDQDHRTTGISDIRFAKEMCKACPVRQQCAEYGITYAEYGIWGGLTPTDRRRLKLRPRRAYVRRSEPLAS